MVSEINEKWIAVKEEVLRHQIHGAASSTRKSFLQSEIAVLKSRNPTSEPMNPEALIFIPGPRGQMDDQNHHR
jgi:hypothetical protein